jgi:peptidoglycan/LPS O-acetylase OafA/YrhL
MGKYQKFAVMIATSTAVMFLLMYLNVYSADHALFSQTRMFMALIMGAGMSVVMLLFMRHMYDDSKKNLMVIALSAVIFALALWLVRSQQTVGDVAWMKAMIPHHSIAILTSERARITDPRSRALADQIIEAQRKEIEEMKLLINDLEQSR